MKLAAALYVLWLIKCALAGVLHHREHAAAVEAGYKRLKGSPHGPGQIKVIKITRTYAVPYPVPVPYTKEVPFPVPIEKAVPVAVPHPFPVPVIRPVHVPQPYIVPFGSQHGIHHSNAHSYAQNYQAHTESEYPYYFNPSGHYQDDDTHNSPENADAQLDYPSFDDDRDNYFPTSSHSYRRPNPSEIEITTKATPIRYSQPDPGFAPPLEHQYPFSEIYHQQTHFKT